MIHAVPSIEETRGRATGGSLICIVTAALLLALFCCPAFADKKADSGWVVAEPLVISDKAGTDDAEAEIVFGKVANTDKTVSPASSKKLPLHTEQAKQSEPKDVEVRIAARSTRSNGWRSVRGSTSQSDPEAGQVPPLPTKTSPSFLLPSTPAKDQASHPDNKKTQPKATKKQPDNENDESAAKETDEPDATTEASEEDIEVEIVEGDEPEVEEPLPELTKEMVQLRYKLRKVLKGYYRKPLNSRDNDPWEVMHGMLAFGIHSRVRKESPRGDLITSVGWLCYNKPCKWQTLMYVSPQGNLRAKYGVGLQGHMGQFLAMLAQCKVSPDYPIRVEKHQFTVQDLIQAEMDTCYPKTELTFKLIALMHYLESDAQWVNDQGQEWSISRLIDEEMAQPIRGAACGGTHRLGGLSLAARTRVKRGEPLDGEFKKAADYVQKYQEYAFRFQNRDGSLSTNWFRGRGDEQDLDRRVKTTGHTLEWLCYSLNDDELTDWRTFRAVNYLTNLLYSNYDHEYEVGPLCHALHALILYDERVFQPYDEKLDVAVRGSRNGATANKNMPAWMR